MQVDDRRMRDLTRMRVVATSLLALMAVIFVAAGLGQGRWPWLSAVRAFAEASIVGACADWFAVTALFRHPLGLPIPHTGIIPRNKDRIGEALGGFIAENFLTSDVLDAKLRQFEVAHWGGVWLAEPGQARRLALRLSRGVPDMVKLLPPNAIRDGISAVGLAAADSLPAAPTASKILAIAWSEGRSQAVLDWIVEQLALYLRKHEAVIHGRVSAQSATWMPKFVDRLISGKIIAGIQQVIEEMRAPDHPWRQEIRFAIEDFIQRLQSDPELGNKAEEVKRTLLQDPRLQEQAQALWAEMERLLFSDDGSPLAERLEKLISQFGLWLQTNETARDGLNEWARALVGRVIAPRRHEIGRFVAQVVAGWDSKSVVDKLELQFGPDLQYIRINGTLVGGLIGLAIYGASHLFGF